MNLLPSISCRPGARLLALSSGLLVFMAGFIPVASAQEEYWFTGEWSDCDEPCGGGSQTREVLCCLPPSCAVIVPDDECASLGPRPEDVQSCNEDPCVAVFLFEIGEWGECSALCADLPGTQTRELRCISYPYGEYVDIDCCNNTYSEVPETTQSCESDLPCERGYWESGEWGDCHAVNCDGSGIRTREVICVDPNPEDGSELLFCDPQTTPPSQESCFTDQNCNDSPGPHTPGDCSCSVRHHGAPPSVLWLAPGLLMLLRRRLRPASRT